MSTGNVQKAVDPLNSKYDHQRLKDQLASLNHQLNDVKENIMALSVRAHILEVDLATLFDPEVLELLNTATKACSSCTKAAHSPLDDSFIEHSQL